MAVDASGEVLPNNPAGRLVAVVRSLQAANGQLAAKEIWAAVLQVPSTGARLFAQLAKFMALVDTTERIVRALPSGGRGIDLYLRYLPELRAVGSYTNLDTAWSNYAKPHLRPEVVDSLEYLDDFLKSTYAEPIINKQELLDIREQTGELLEEVRQAEIPIAIKDYIIETLEAILQAVDDCPLLGVQPLQDALNRAVGAAALRDEVREDGGGNEWVKKTFDVLKKIGTLLQVPAATLQIATGFLALTAGTPPHLH